MLPQYMALSVSFASFVCQKNLRVCLLGYIVGASPLSVKICVSVRWVTLWVRPPPLCVSIQLVTLWLCPPLVCVLSLKDNLCWILACCLLRFAAFFFLMRGLAHWVWSFPDIKHLVVHICQCPQNFILQSTMSNFLLILINPLYWNCHLVFFCWRKMWFFSPKIWLADKNILFSISF